MMALTLEEHDADIKAMEEKFNGKWQELCLDLVNAPCADAIDKLWKGIVLARDPNYGDWEYPGQAYRHLLAEYNDLKTENERMEAELWDHKLYINLHEMEPRRSETEEYHNLFLQTKDVGEHPSWYDGPCLCRLCCSYG